MTELYREIQALEFRGDGFYEAEWAGVIWQQWLSATPPRWTFAVYPGDKFILQALGNDDYRIVGVSKPGDPRWGIPLPERTTDVEYRVWGHQVANLTARTAAL